MDLHVAQSVAALQRGIHVLCEVSASTDIGESRQLGEVYYAEGEFNQNIQSILKKTPWRRRWQVGVNGITYGPHSLGPILQWMAGDRVTAASCAGAGHRYRDEQDRQFESEVATTMLCRMRSGGLTRVRCDLLSERPMGVHYQLQGTDGFYDRSELWLRSRNHDSEHCEPIQDLKTTYLSDAWREADARCRAAGCASDDYLMALDFVEGIRRGEPVTLDIHEAMEMTLPGLVSQASIAQNSDWLEVPDSRAW